MARKVRLPAWKRIKPVVRMGLAPFLKQEGFSKDGEKFRRKIDGRIEVVAVRRERQYEDHAEAFSVDLGVYYPEVHRLVFPADWPAIDEPDAILARSQPRTKLPPEFCPLRKSLHSIRYTAQPWDNWAWNLASDADIPGAADELADVWKELGRPWLDEMADLRAARAWVREHNPLCCVSNWTWAAAFSILLEEFDEAKQDLARALDDGPHPEDLRDTPERLGQIVETRQVPAWVHAPLAAMPPEPNRGARVDDQRDSRKAIARLKALLKAENPEFNWELIEQSNTEDDSNDLDQDAIWDVMRSKFREAAADATREWGKPRFLGESLSPEAVPWLASLEMNVHTLAVWDLDGGRRAYIVLSWEDRETPMMLLVGLASR